MVTRRKGLKQYVCLQSLCFFEDQSLPNKLIGVPWFLAIEHIFSATSSSCFPTIAGILGFRIPAFSVAISKIEFPKIVYMIVNKNIEVEIKLLKDYPEW